MAAQTLPPRGRPAGVTHLDRDVGGTTAEHDRRGALGLVAGGFAAAALLLPGRSKAQESEQAGGEGEVTANEDLMREHGVLRRILIVYREVVPKIVADPAAVDAGAIAGAATLFHDFGERYHEQLLEEQRIFPLVRNAGGEAAAMVDTLLTQHQRGREITAFVLDRTRNGRIATGAAPALSRAMAAFTRMYEAHTAREDTMIFPAFKKAIGADRYRELGEQFEQIEHREFGGDGFDMALDTVEAIERALGLADLARFTAPAPGAA